MSERSLIHGVAISQKWLNGTTHTHTHRHAYIWIAPLENAHMGMHACSRMAKLSLDPESWYAFLLADI